MGVCPAARDKSLLRHVGAGPEVVSEPTVMTCSNKNNILYNQHTPICNLAMEPVQYQSSKTYGVPTVPISRSSSETSVWHLITPPPRHGLAGPWRAEAEVTVATACPGGTEGLIAPNHTPGALSMPLLMCVGLC